MEENQSLTDQNFYRIFYNFAPLKRDINPFIVMIIFKKLLLSICFVLFAATLSYSQEKSPVNKDVVNQQLWMDFYIKVQKNDRFNYLFDFGYETIFLDNYWNKIYHETSVNYQLSNRFDLKGGVAFYYHFNQDIDNRFELRPWQAIVYKVVKRERINIGIQTKIEQRLSWLMDNKTYNYDFRLRMKVAGSVKCFKNDLDWYVPFVAEYFYPIKDNIPEVFHNVAKIGVGIGKKFNDRWNGSFMANWQYSRSGPQDQYKVSDFAYQFQVTRLIDKRK
ncbi:DUF2490 domain-containing protein [Flammeovirga sp. SubArs3]|uniref:DUF2490 domain-containing protein n=1 Tax=Flammeovirga sp. SubArs3 TaxID=2995316 RepID=UPI00248CEF9D|nr:DUF2490 domain-containing protein [Flammeovirga sp. SubArs3]